MEKEKIVSIEDRIPKLKQMRKKRANRKLLIYLSIFFFLIMIIVYLESPLSNIQDVEVSGNVIMDELEIIKQSGLSESVNIWMINQSYVEEQILKQPIVKSVEVNRKLPQSVEIIVEEYSIVGFILEDGKSLPVLSNGDVVNTDGSTLMSNAPILNKFTDEQYLKRMADELTELPEQILNLISEIIWEPTDKNKYKIILYMNDGFTVNATIRNFANKMEAYPSIVSQLDPNEKGIVHMGVGTYFEKTNEEVDSELSSQEVPEE